ncbi:MAG: EAL domain-containing protein [Acidimicrobiales bacterium]
MKNSERSGDDIDYSQLARVADRLLTPVAVIGSDSSLRYINDVAAQLFESDPRGLIGQKMLSLVHPDDRARITEDLAKVMTGDPGGGFTQCRLRATNSQPWHVVDLYAHNLTDDPDVCGILVSGGDVSEQVSLARALRTLSQCNEVLVHAEDESTLIANICRTIIEAGGYALAWVGYVEHDAARSIRVVDSYGATEYLDGLEVTWADDELGQGSVGRAIRSGTTKVIRDTRRSKRVNPWRERLEAHHMRTTCALPLIIKGETIGVLAIYGLEVGAFGEGELELIGKLAANLAYGIGRIRDAKNLALNESRLRAAERLTHVGHWEWDLSSDHFDFLADEMFAIYGVAPSEWTRSPEIFLSFVNETERQLVEDVFRDAIKDGSAAVAHHITRPNGDVRSVRIRAEAIHDQGGRPVRLLGTVQDITEYLEAKIQLAQSRQFLLAITDNMAEGMIATDGEGIITFANTAAGFLLHTSARDLVGRATDDAFIFRQDGTAQADDSPLARVWKEGRSLIIDHETLVRGDGSSVPIALSASPLRDENQSGAVIVFEDITDRAAAQLRVERELEKLAWVGRIRDALDNDRFVLYSQPIIDLATYDVIQNELLIRMIDADGEIIMPDSFLPTAEEYGLIGEIDRWVINETARLSALGHSLEFNLSAKSVADPRTLSLIESAIAEHGGRAEHIVCEITETALVRDLRGAEQFVRGLNNLGVKVALDDFGAGYSGFAYLKRLPVSYLKIDRELVQDLHEEISSRYVVSAVVSLAKAFGMDTVAEGAENDETLRLLKELGVDHVQGYVLGRPAPVSETLLHE